MGNCIRGLIILALPIFLTGCFEELASKVQSTLTAISTAQVSEITSADFSGALNAQNLVTGIRVNWQLSQKQAASYRVYKVLGKHLSLIGTVGGGTAAFIDGNINYGTIYSYVVRAVDENGIEETNVKQVNALAWGGISNIIANNRTSLTINFTAPTAVADKINIYMRPAGSSVAKTLITTASGSDDSISLSNLRPGYSYEISAQAYVNSLKAEDGNDVTFIVSTQTESFHYDSAVDDPPHYMSIINLRAFGDSPGTQPHPGNLEKQPSTRQVEIYFNSFRNMGPSTKYVVIRTADDGRPIDTQNGALAACTTSTLSSCLPSTPTPCRFSNSGGTLKCVDKDVAISPAKYLYTLVKIQEDGSEQWVEPFPMEFVNQFALRVQIPPNDMVLVHRDSVNFEMCNLMNKPLDPLNHNRCAYTGIGDRPYSSGHNKPALNLTLGYYDFGYNLFVDRYNLGCNWTSAANGGMCGPGGTAGNCIGTITNQYYSGATPSSSLGVDGNVYVMLNSAPNSYSSSYCYQKVAGSWRSAQYIIANNLGNPKNLIGNMFTNNPSLNQGKILPINNAYLTLWPVGANLTCNAFVDPNYGPKRIPRMREYRAYSAFPTNPNEPYYVPYAKVNSWLAQTSVRNDANGYGCMDRQNVLDTFPTSIAQLLAPTNQLSMLKLGSVQYGHGSFLGTNFTADCQSRYGVNDVMTNRVVSDYMWYSYSLNPKRMIGNVSPIDNGNRDFLKDISSGQETGLRIDLTNFATNTSDYYSSLATNSSQNYIAVSLGVPVFLSSSADYLARPSFIESFGQSFNGPSLSWTADRSVAFSVGSRWKTYPSGLSDWNANNGGAEDWYDNRLQCVLPAE